MRWTDLTQKEWPELDVRALAKVKTAGTVQTIEKEEFRKDGSRVKRPSATRPLLTVAVASRLASVRCSCSFLATGRGAW